jgi:hypothetical protein
MTAGVTKVTSVSAQPMGRVMVAAVLTLAQPPVRPSGLLVCGA